ncbi:hypothetical protein [Tsukamurella paurometabola]|uniref:Type II toxin-antitoxin system ParD family antitoxin n=1 Tax=Tsukamurella paurometabola TaxID=2061 RepID=A0ABS5NG59_TSUPA|nr:hypothetical protein [Tsukamurella paurometabola]MBS4102852.1 hypothetical protein [Tsukamurella paurometabola]
MNENNHDLDYDLDASAERYQQSTDRFNGMLANVLASVHDEVSKSNQELGRIISNLEEGYAAGQIDVRDEKEFSDVLENLRAIKDAPVRIPRPEDMAG